MADSVERRVSFHTCTEDSELAGGGQHFNIEITYLDPRFLLPVGVAEPALPWGGWGAGDIYRTGVLPIATRYHILAR